METVKIRNYELYWDITADIHFPPNFDKSKKYPAIISARPIGSCKHQTSGNVYGVALANEGFLVIAFDASFQGASGGEPRFIEDPTLRVEDFRHVADYLVTLPYVAAPARDAAQMYRLRREASSSKRPQHVAKCIQQHVRILARKDERWPDFQNIGIRTGGADEDAAISQTIYDPSR